MLHFRQCIYVCTIQSILVLQKVTSVKNDSSLECKIKNRFIVTKY